MATTTTPDPRTQRDPSSERPRSSDVASDPVCAMDVNPNEARFRSDRNGEAVYFCSEACKSKFDREPEKYA